MEKISLRSLWFVMSLTAISFSGAASAQALPTPSSMVSSALGQGIAKNLISRGFAANDPRILTTIEAISTEALPIAAEAAAGGTWLGTMAVLTPYTLAAVAVGAGLYWYFDSTGKVYTSPPGTVVSSISSPGVQLGATLWLAPGTTVYFGTPQEALGYVFSQSIASNPTATFSTPTFTQNSSTQYTATYTYSISGLGIPNSSGSKVIVGYAQSSVDKGGVTCPAGAGFNAGSSTCITVNFAGTPFAPIQAPGTSLQTAYSNLSSSIQSAPLNPALASELANRLWKNAASQPNYPGLPISSAIPVSPANFSDYQTANPSLWPPTSALSSSVPTTAIIAPSTTSTANTSNPGAGSAEVNLGPDPGNSAPSLDTPPSGVFAPIKALMSGWTSWTVPTHSGVCPTWSISPSIAGHVFNIDLNEHCVIAEQWRSSIATIAMIAWLVVAAFIVLSA